MAPQRKAAFTVFVDDACVAESSTSKSDNVTTSSTITTTTTSTTITTLALAAEHEKENIDPLTGLRAGATVAKGKKRKAPLVTKTIQPLQVKSIKTTKDIAEKKKRTVKSKDAGKSKASRTRKPKANKSRSPSLPSVAEGHEDLDRAQQAEIDSRCYDLTVLPLADVSEAYDGGSPSKRRAIAVPLVKVTRDKSLEPEISDSYIPSEHDLGLKTRGRSVSLEPEQPQSFSTPEREQIYSNFTFSSPSKSAERYRRVKDRSLSPEEAAVLEL